jgi:hypothetical protein
MGFGGGTSKVGGHWRWGQEVGDGGKKDKGGGT